MKHYLLVYLNVIMISICFSLNGMQPCKHFISESLTCPISKKTEKILLIDAYIQGSFALNANGHLAFSSCSNSSHTYNIDTAFKYITKLMRQQSRSTRSYGTKQAIELSILLLSNLHQDEDALLDLQKKRLHDFISLEIPQKDLLKHLEKHSDELLYDRLEEQLGGPIIHLSHEEIVKAVEHLSNNRRQLQEALKTKNPHIINEASAQKLQLESICIHQYITRQCKKYQERLSLTMQKFIQ